MGFSIRDERGQGVVEYILVLVVTVMLVLGVVYQLNSAFRIWSENYFGSYLACLLETGELPNMGGPGGGGVCDQLYQPYTPFAGRPPVANPTTPGGGQGGGQEDRGGGQREVVRGDAGSGYTRIGSGTGGWAGSGGRGGQGGQARRQPIKGKTGSVYTGSTDTGGYGGGYSASNNRRSTQVRTRLDNRFAFEQDREERQTRQVASVTKKNTGENRPKRTVLKRIDYNRDRQGEVSSGLSVPDMLRYLIIAAILIAVLLFLGSQAMQINKSME